MLQFATVVWSRAKVITNSITTISCAVKHLAPGFSRRHNGATSQAMSQVVAAFQPTLYNSATIEWASARPGDKMKYAVYDHGNRTQPKIALTFDDGPNPSRTEQVLDILAHHNAHATFFVIGEWATRFPDTLRRTIDGGHMIGNHTFSHASLSDYERAEEIIQKAVGKPSVFFREPRLDFDLSWQSRLATSDTNRLISADVQVLDWLQTDQNVLARLILESPDLKNGSIVLLHDGSHLEHERLDRPRPVIGALPEVISQLKMRGFEFVGLDQMELVDPVWYDSPPISNRRQTE